MFFDYHVAKFAWNAVFVTFRIQPPASVSHLLGSWLGVFSLKLRKQMLVGVAALCWVLWLNRNDAVFNRKLPKSYLQVFLGGLIGPDSGRSCLRKKRKIFWRMSVDS